MSVQRNLGAVLLVIGALTGWVAWQNRAVRPVLSTTDLRSDYVLKNFELVALNEAGQESITLRAPEMQRNPSDETLSVEQPLFLLPDEEGLHWDLRAQTGWLSAKGDELRLRQNVIAVSPPESKKTPPTKITTESLDVFPQKNHARSAEAVQITRPGMLHTGVGMEAFLDTRQFQLLSQVKMRYDRSTP